MLNRKEVYKQDYVFHFLDEIKNFLPKSPYKNLPLIQLWYQTFLLLSGNSSEKIDSYWALKKLIKSYSKSLTKSEMRVFYGYLSNQVKNVI